MNQYTLKHVRALHEARKHLEQALAQLDTVPLANNNANVALDAKILTSASAIDALLRVNDLIYFAPSTRANRQLIAAAFQRHIDERHGADFEVCADPECQKAVALERDMIYPD